MYAYPIGLAVISLFVALLERLFPWREEQRPLRRTLLSDTLHLLFNGHFLGVILYGIATHHILPPMDHWLAANDWLTVLYRGIASTWSLPVQIVVSLFVIDFMQWCVHNLLHRVPWLWSLHKTHHSVQDGEMDWIVSFRFQWTEVVVYKTLQYFPLAFFGFSSDAVLFHALFGTLIGHLNHANLNLDWGPLKYLLNSPRMHIWHHDYEGDEKSTVNFGIIFSCWDWLFGTAKMPGHPPKRIGFSGVQRFPQDFLSQSAWPLSGWIPGWGRQGFALWAARILGGGILAFGWWIHLPASPASASVAAHDDNPLEPAASSQPANARADFHYAKTPEEAESALLNFGDNAKSLGFLHPEMLVSVDELAHALGARQLRILDVRPQARFALGHIPGARNVSRPDYSTTEPIPGLSRDGESLYQLLEREGIYDDDEVILYTDGGPEAFRLWWTLRTVTGIRARVLDGGLVRWKEQGHPVVEGAGFEIPRGSLTRRKLPKPGASLWHELAPLLQGHPPVWLDTRSEAEYLGEKQHRKAARAGRIPGAIHLEWTALFRSPSDPRLLTPTPLRARFESVDVRPSDRVVTYCQTGTRSAATFFALYQLGYDEDRLLNYDGSWTEYSRLEHLPVERGPYTPSRTR